MTVDQDDACRICWTKRAIAVASWPGDWGKVCEDCARKPGVDYDGCFASDHDEGNCPLVPVSEVLA